MSRKKRLIIDTIIYALGNFGTKFLLFFMLPIYTSYFTTEEYGRWDVINTTVSMFIPFVTFELVSATYRWLISEKNLKSKKAIFTTGLIKIIKNLLIFNIISILTMLFINIDYGVLILILINSSIILSYFQQVSRGVGINKLFVLSGVLNTVLIFSLNVYFMFGLKFRLESFFLSSIFSNIITSIFIWWLGSFNKLFDLKLKSNNLYKEFIKYSLPLIPSTVSLWVINVSDRYLISYFLGDEYNGIYAVANKIPSLLIMLSSIFLLAWKDNMLKEANSDDKDSYYSTVFSYYFKFMIGTIIVLIASSQLILDILVSSNFKEAWKYSILLLVATLFNIFSQFWATGYHASKQTKSLLHTSIISASTNILINLVFIRWFGLYAAAISTIISFMITWLLRVLDRKKNFKINISIRKVIILFFILVLYLILSYIENTIFNLILILSSLFLFVILNLDMVKSVFSLIIKVNRKVIVKKSTHSN